MCRDLKTRLYGRAMLYTGAPGQMVKEANVTENFKAGESENNTDYYNSTFAAHEDYLADSDSSF